MNNSDKNKNNDDSKITDFLEYPPSKDIFCQGVKEEDIDPNDTSKMKEGIDQKIVKLPNELDFENVITGKDLDVPGSGLDNEMEQIGSEDEENNYYSIGGNNHHDLEENKVENDL